VPNNWRFHRRGGQDVSDPKYAEILIDAIHVPIHTRVTLTFPADAVCS